MSEVYVTKWSEENGGPLTEDAIRATHRPVGHYRIAANKYPAGTQFSASSRPGVFYVLGGACRLLSGSGGVTLSAGDVAQFRGGSYELEVAPEHELHIVQVWQLPEEFWT